MAVQESMWIWWSAGGNAYHTVDVNLAPGDISAQVDLHGTRGGGTGYVGFSGYRRRLSSGADEVHGFGEWYQWPPAISDFISSFTIAIATVSDQKAWAVTRVDFWG